MNKLSINERAQVVAALVEGNSINSTVRMTGISKPTILKLIAELGDACKRYHDEHVCHLLTKRVQCDEIWAFCYAKQKNVPVELEGKFGFGDLWTWVGIDADTKLIIRYMVYLPNIVGDIGNGGGADQEPLGSRGLGYANGLDLRPRSWRRRL
jgi:hypothetical protein